MNIPELLAPAGSPEALDAAFGEGADAVYLGLKNFNARLRSSNFPYSRFEAALRAMHRAGRKIYVTVNTVFEERETDRMYQLLKYLAAVGPDGVIVQDFGVVKMVRDCFPALKLHASTQMNVSGAAGVNLLSKYGVSRVVLSRELSLKEIRAIRTETASELEVFVHGALCVCVSGLCLFSSYLGGKSANRGLCAQACRRLYRCTETGREDEEGYYFSPADLELAEGIPALAEAGISSFKIEGRMKSADYVGAVTAAYRRILDSLGGDTATGLLAARDILRGDFARKKTSFFFYGDEKDKSRDDRESGGLPAWLDPAQSGGVGIPLGTLIRVRGGGEQRQGLIAFAAPSVEAGDSVRLHRADDSERKAHKVREVLADPNGGGVWISIPEGFLPGDQAWLIQRRAGSRHYRPLIQEDLARFRRTPGHDRAPEPVFAPPQKPGAAERKRGRSPGQKSGPAKLLPAGLYAAVSRVEDLYAVQSARPDRVIVKLNPRTAARLLEEGGQPLPFGRKDMILELDPWFPQGDAETLREQITALREIGFSIWIVNSLGHFSLFRGGPEPPLLVAGPWLYTFNRWSLAFVSALGAEALVTPLENSRQNLERSVPEFRRPLCFVTLFSWPPLFRIRADLGAYGFGAFRDSQNSVFHLQSAAWGSAVRPEEPFSIVDKRRFLEEAGFRRFILDFSGCPGGVLKKKDYRAVMDAAREGQPLSGITRFNWKDGFFHLEEDTRPAFQTGSPRRERPDSSVRKSARPPV